MSGNSVYRQRAKIIVSLFPGIHLRELQRSLNISFNTTRHHVDALSKAGEILREDDGGYTRLYPAGTNAGDKALFSSARSPTKRLILSALVQTPNLTNKHLSDLTALAKSTVSEHVQELINCGVVRAVVSPESRLTYSLWDPVAVSNALSKSERAALDSLADRFIDLWDF